MATGTAGTTARQYDTAQVHYIRKTSTFADGITATVSIGIIPSGALVIDAGMYVKTSYNWGTNNLINLGTAGDTDGFATSLSLATVGLIKWDELATSNDVLMTADTWCTATYICTGSDATRGEIELFVAFLADNDG
jgi:hypothetical protein